VPLLVRSTGRQVPAATAGPGARAQADRDPRQPRSPHRRGPPRGLARRDRGAGSHPRSRQAETPGHAADRRPPRRHQPRHARLPRHRRALQHMTATRRETSGRDYFADTLSNRSQSQPATMTTLRNVRIRSRSSQDSNPTWAAVVAKYHQPDSLGVDLDLASHAPCLCRSDLMRASRECATPVAHGRSPGHREWSRPSRASGGRGPWIRRSVRRMEPATPAV
jgi:hypothetical protein